MSDLHQSLRAFFGFGNFRPGQKEAITAAVEGRDVLAVLPTGGGKSLIYQLPALMAAQGVTIVISPLISLMNDQTSFLREKGLPAAAAHSSLDELEQMKVMSLAVQGKIRLLYISPERAASLEFGKLLSKMKVNYIAVDEAHCISKWGHEFRPEYREIGRLRDILNRSGQNPPFIALTATATEKVKSDIIKTLGLDSPAVIQESFYRSNLRFSVMFPESENQKKEFLLMLLENAGFRTRKSPGKAVVYCATRKKTEEVYKFLKENGFRASRYHAGRSGPAREKAQTAYMAGKHDVLAATNAFGMGVDQPDVRLVIHYQIPDSLEAYYQEAGRAGRDRGEADCVLFYSEADAGVRAFMSGSGTRSGIAGGTGILSSEAENLLQYVKDYALGRECRQVSLCRYFGETVHPCGKCDVCTDNPVSREGHARITAKTERKKALFQERASVRLSDEEEKFIDLFLMSFPGLYGRKILSGTLRGSRSRDILRFKLNTWEHYGALRHIPQEAIERSVSEKQNSGIIRISGIKYPKLYLAEYPPFPKRKAGRTTSSPPERKASDPVRELVRELKKYRDSVARKHKWKKFMVLQNAVIERIARSDVRTEEDLLHIKGMGSLRTEHLGQDILEIIRRHRG